MAIIKAWISLLGLVSPRHTEYPMLLQIIITCWNYIKIYHIQQFSALIWLDFIRCRLPIAFVLFFHRICSLFGLYLGCTSLFCSSFIAAITRCRIEYVKNQTKSVLCWLSPEKWMAQRMKIILHYKFIVFQLFFGHL